MKRSCFACGGDIARCNGFVLAGDFLQALEGNISWSAVRERCGYCVERKLMNATGGDDDE